MVSVDHRPVSLALRLVGILAVVLIAVMGTSLIQGHRVDDAIARSERDTREAHQATRLALTAQVHFKKQVQEWKNVLLRGADPKLYEKYRGQFEEEEAEVRSATRQLLNLLPPDSVAGNAATAFANAHSRLGTAYRAGLELFDRDRTNPFRVDTSVRGIDRQPTDLLDDVVLGVDAWGNERVESAALHIAAARRDVYLAQAIVFSLAIIFMLAALRSWVVRPVQQAIRLAERVSKGDLTTALKVRAAPGEVGRLLQVLQTMQDELRVNKAEREAYVQKIEEARNQAQAGDVAKTQFLNKVSHELITPLNGILGNLDLLKGEVPGSAMGYLDDAQTSSRNLYTLVREVLAYSEIESGLTDLERQVVEPRKLVTELEQKYEYYARNRNVGLSFRVDPNVPDALHGDDEKVTRVLEYLIDNALKFTHQGFVEVRILRAERFESGIRAEVIDSGIGIPESERHRVFQKFTQVDESNARSYGGLGLGLALSRGHVELMGGEINFTSVVDEGTTFWFEVPLDAGPASRPQDTLARPEGGQAINGAVL